MIILGPGKAAIESPSRSEQVRRKWGQLFGPEKAIHYQTVSTVRSPAASVKPIGHVKIGIPKQQPVHKQVPRYPARAFGCWNPNCTGDRRHRCPNENGLVSKGKRIEELHLFRGNHFVRRSVPDEELILIFEIETSPAALPLRTRLGLRCVVEEMDFDLVVQDANRVGFVKSLAPSFGFPISGSPFVKPRVPGLGGELQRGSDESLEVAEQFPVTFPNQEQADKGGPIRQAQCRVDGRPPAIVGNDAELSVSNPPSEPESRRFIENLIWPYQRTGP